MMSNKASSGERFVDTPAYAKANRGAGETKTEASRSRAASALLIKLACIFYAEVLRDSARLEVLDFVSNRNQVIPRC